MGTYLNPNANDFRENIHSEIYVDKTLLIEKLNAVISTRQKFVCVSRPRRFGKSMAIEMLAAYYSRGENCGVLFDGLKIKESQSFEKHLNKYDVIKINMQVFLSATNSVEEMLAMLAEDLIRDIRHAYPDKEIRDRNFITAMLDTYASTGRQFVILIDEWDCLFREYKNDTESQKKYLDFLRMWMKDQSYVALAYMTGILPIKKYGTHSALNMFDEYSMMLPGSLAEYFGFTEAEVKALCERYRMSFEEAKDWYDGYELVSNAPEAPKRFDIYNPKSIVDAMRNRHYAAYWNKTETYEALKIYIQMNEEGLKDAVLFMLAGESVEIRTDTFTNDMTTFTGKDDVLTLLIHLGYLSHSIVDYDKSLVRIPNKEVARELESIGP